MPDSLPRMLFPIPGGGLFRHFAGAIRPKGMLCAGGAEGDLLPAFFAGQLHGVVPQAVVDEHRARLL